MGLAGATLKDNSKSQMDPLILRVLIQSCLEHVHRMLSIWSETHFSQELLIQRGRKVHFKELSESK